MSSARDAAKTTATFEPLTTASARGPAGRLHVLHPRDFTAGSFGASVIDLSREPLTLGRSTQGPGRLGHTTISREHLRIAWDGRAKTHTATDPGSHNGTWVDGQRLEAGATLPLRDNAVLRLGGVVLVYERGPFDHDATGPLADTIPGRSRAASLLRHQLTRAGPDPSPVLLQGETGAGKEHVARALHTLSARPGPLVSINVAELGPQLAESQLFGHLKGAFTGADRPHDGLFRAADRGTLLLDEIGELPLDLQPKLLRALQESEVRPVGSTRTVPVDVRVVAATNRDLAADIERGAFRRDLYARLALWEVEVPPLARRRADIPTWIDRLNQRWCERRKVPTALLIFEADALELVLRHPFPDNLRGLDRLVHRLAAAGHERLVPADEIRAALNLGADPDAPAASAPPAERAPAAPKRAAPTTREELLAVVDQHDGNMQAVARHYGRDRRQVYRWLDAFGIRRGPGEDP